jgi:hypothetical protein
VLRGCVDRGTNKTQCNTMEVSGIVAPTDTTPTDTASQPVDQTTSKGALFVVELDQLRSKSNFRRSRGTSGQEWASLRRYEEGVALTLRAVRPGSWDTGEPGLSVSQRPGVIVVIYARTLLDAGNLSKSLLDAAQGVLYVTDASVRAVTEFTERTKIDQRAWAGFAQVPAGASLSRVAEVNAELSTAVLRAAVPH